MDTSFFQVTPEEINLLDENQLVALLSSLMYQEAKKNNIPASNIHCNLKVQIPDGGIDARISWENGVKITDYFPNRLVGYQCKASDMGPTACKNEMIKKDKKTLKPGIENILDNGGVYIIFCRQIVADDSTRLNSMKKAIIDAGRSNDLSHFLYFYDANKIASWVNQYLSSVLLVKKYVGKQNPISALTWEEWKGYSEYSNVFYDDRRADYIQQIRNCLYNGTRNIIQVEGLVGLGKSRLILESFNHDLLYNQPNEDSIVHSLQNEVVYIDANKTIPNNIFDLAIYARRENMNAILIVDNCSPEIYKSLCQDILHEDSSLSLVTICDFLSSDSQNNKIEIKPDMNYEIVKKMIENEYQKVLGNNDIEHIIQFAQGFPLLAHMLCEARLHEKKNMGQLEDEEIAHKLIWGNDDKDKECFEVLKAASLFTNFRLERGEEEYKDIANIVCGPTVDSALFYRAVKYFHRRGIIERHGGLYCVIPPPLAVSLSAQWFEETPPDRIVEIIEQLPRSLIESLCQRLEYLHFSPEAVKIAGMLCEPRFFGQAEILKSERGSRVFRALCPITPEAAAKSLNNVFKNMTIDEIKKIDGTARRNLVWAMDDLCFWEHSFLLAGEILILFAAGENEKWSNNATGNLLQLFRIQLPGTQADLQMRLDLFDMLLSNKGECFDTLAIKAIESAMDAQHFTKMITSEQQGGRITMENYRPKYWSEIKEYFIQMFDRLCRYAVQRNSTGEDARKVITENIWSWVQKNYYLWISKELEDLGEKLGFQWDEMYRTLKEQNSFLWEKLDESRKEYIDHLRKQYIPNSFSEKIRLTVSNAPKWVHVKNEKGGYDDLGFKEAQEFGEACGGNKNIMDEVYRILPTLVEQIQAQANAFGRGIAKHNIDHKKFLDLYFEALKNADKPDSNILVGYISIIKDNHRKLVSEILNKIAHEEKLFDELVYLTCSIVPSKDDLVRVLSASGVAPIPLKRFMLGDALGHLDADTALWFCSEIMKMGNAGKSSALEISHMILFSHDNYFRNFEELIFHLITDPYIIVNKDETQHEKYTWQEMSRKIAKNACIDRVKSLLETILNWVVRNNKSLDFDNSIFPVIHEIILRIPEESLDMIVTKYWTIDTIQRMNLTKVCQGHSGGKDNNIFNGVNVEIIHKWIKRHDKKSIPFIFEAISPLIKEGVIEDISAYIINEYGDDEEIQKCFVQNIWGRIYTFWGNTSTQYKLMIGAMEPFSNHKNPETKRWINNFIQDLQRMYDAEKIDEEEDTLRHF